ncbi:MAG TPA: condensation domain-containing protein, partial [Candidatus Kapabacteria bacterium]|nr:condensation domain-containing protein [Candidatus Kapabacteria bacterium]
RGFRIELGEIESRLLKHEDIKEAVVIERNMPNGDLYLCAYIVPRVPQPGVNTVDLKVSSLREFLSQELPDYMIPTHFFQIEKIPITPNGKIDKKELKKMGESLNSGVDYSPPTTEIEILIAGIWKEVLQIEDVGIFDNFFDLGGNSLKAITLIARIHKELNVKIPLPELFNKPTIQKLADMIDKFRQLAQSNYRAIEPAEKKEYYPLSPAQKRLYILHRMDEQSTGYNIPFYFLLTGKLNKDKFENAFKRLISRHEILKTSFHMIDNEPAQRVCDDVKFEIEILGIDEPDSISNRSDIIKNFMRPFDLAKPPLIRVALRKMAEEKHLLMVDMHHIVSDAFSINIVVNNFMIFYRGEDLPRLRIQYKDFSEWCCSQNQKESLKQQEDFWLNQFAGEIPVLELPIDYLRPTIQSFEGDTINFEIEQETTNALKALKLETGDTLFMILLAIYTIFLAKITNQEDIVVGSPSAGRRHADLENITGMFVNTLALRNYPLGEKTFYHFLQEVKERTLNAFENQDYQYEELVKKIVLTRDGSRNPLFDTMFALLNPISQKIDIPGLNLAPYKFEHKIAKFDLLLTVIDFEEKLIFTLDYCTKLFKRKTIENLVTYIKNVINRIISNPGVKIAEVEIISEETRKEHLNYFNENLQEPFKIKPIQAILADSFQKYRENMAIEYGALRMVYAELEYRMACISTQIADYNIEEGTFIGIYSKDKSDIIATVIGILNMNCIFVPLDTTLPVKRIENMIKLANIRDIFTDGEHESIVNDLKDRNSNIGHIFVLDRVFNRAQGLVNTKVQKTHYNKEDKVYVYFTSGTTGIPHVIVGKNESLVQFLLWQIEKFSIHKGYRISQLAAVGFDAFLRDIFIPLFVGGTICIPLPADMESLADWIDISRINLVHCVPSLFRLINTDEMTAANYTHLKYIIMSGEPLQPNELKRWYEVFADRIQLINYYGTSETTMSKTYHLIQSNEVESKRIPAGLPMRGARTIILDKYLKLCDKGIVGEIYIKTPYRTYGYLNDPELNAERFIKNPFNENDMAFLHKTGDIGRELENGEIELQGRIDRQVKIRGIRIELENIENCLLKHGKIDRAIVINQKNSAGETFLCAYIILKKEEAGVKVEPGEVGITISTSELREFLEKELPEYMIPPYFVVIDKVPLTPNGKIDTKALPKHEIKIARDGIIPLNAMEEKLIELWGEILGIEENVIGMDSNFFELGGHSLKVMTLLARIHREFDVRVPLAEMFKAPTIRKLSRYIREAGEDINIAIQPAEKKEYYPLSSAQRRLYFLQQMIKTSTTYNMFSGWILEGIIDENRLEQTIKKLIHRHESLRTSIHIINDELVQRIQEEVEFGIEHLVTNSRDEHEQTQLSGRGIPLSFIRSFDLSKAPLLRVGLIKEINDRCILMVDMHHIISDGISINILVKDFMDLYQGDNLSALLIQYKDFSAWQNNEKQGEPIKRQEEYWLKEFAGKIPVLELPYDYPRPLVQSFEGNKITFEIDKQTTSILKALNLKMGVTMYMMLLAIHTVFLAKVSSQEDIVVGSPIAGRRHVDLEKIIGMFVNTLALRNYPSGEKKFSSFLEEVKENILISFENQDYQYEDLIEQVVIGRDTSRNPLFDAVFVLQNMDNVGVNIPGLKLSPYPLEDKTAKFDLSLIVVETREKLLFYFEYSTNLFKKETIDRFIAYFVNILQGVIENNEKKISDLEIITEEEKNQVLFEFNDTESIYPKDKTIHQLFAEQASKAPDQITIIGPILHDIEMRSTSPQQITYRQLNEQADKLVGLLMEKGVLSGSIVGMMTGRSIEMIVGILGILKSGGAYLPIDPEYPQERIYYMLADSGAQLLVTNNDKEDEKVKKWEGDKIFLESIIHDSNHLKRRPRSGHSSFSIQPSNLAYIIYTSGTTGKPKGVLVEHKNVVRLLFNDRFQFDFNDQDVWSLFHSYNFDFSVW